jgi:hypothetical protein
MPHNEEIGKEVLTSDQLFASSLIERSKVAPNLPYTEYKRKSKTRFHLGVCILHDF